MGPLILVLSYCSIFCLFDGLLEHCELNIFLSIIFIYSCLTFYATLNYHTSYFCMKTCLVPSTCHMYSSAVESGTVQLFLRPSSLRLTPQRENPSWLCSGWCPSLPVFTVEMVPHQQTGASLKKKGRKKSLLSFPEDLEIQLISVRHKSGGLLWKRSW